MKSPYDTVDWESVKQLHSVNHTHTFSTEPDATEWVHGEGKLDGQQVFHSMYERGIRHFAISNYHPSKPTYPLSRYFSVVPEDAIGCPNAEHYIIGSPGHFSSLGSHFATGHGFQGTWSEMFDEVFDSLAFDSGGGVVINHPRRTKLSDDVLIEMLNYDERVLGIEVYNDRSEMSPKYNQTGDALALWDRLLSTGRMIYGFFNPDYHSPWKDDTRGRNILLVDEVSERAALEAYRQGQFYGAFNGGRLKFTRISDHDHYIDVETTCATRIDFISEGEIVATTFGPTGSYSPRGDEIYVRIEATSVDGDKIFSQPYVF